jgi:hypothetical protein
MTLKKYERSMPSIDQDGILPALRPDIVFLPQGRRQVRRYLVAHPETKEFFELGTSEVQLCRLLDGQRNKTEILSLLRTQHQLQLSL